jgi:hypothetical protein
MIIVGMVGAIALLGGAAWSVLTSERQSMIERSADSYESMALVLSQEAGSVFSLANAVLGSMIDELDLGADDCSTKEEFLHQELVKKRKLLLASSEFPSWGHLFILHKDGFNVANSVSYPPKRVNALDIPYFIQHQNNPSLDLHISQPRFSRVTK